MKQKFRRYKGRVFGRSKSRVPRVLLGVLLAAALIVAGYFFTRWMAGILSQETSSDGHSSSESSVSFGSSSSDVPSSTTTPATVPTTPPTSSTAGTTAPTAPPASLTGQQIADLAVSLIGTDYQLGAAGPTAFDNVGFVYYCFKQANIVLPRRVSALLEQGTPVEQVNLQPGDVVFFSNTIGKPADYIGIYVGDGRFVASNRPGRPTSRQSLTNAYFQPRYITARRYG